MVVPFNIISVEGLTPAPCAPDCSYYFQNGQNNLNTTNVTDWDTSAVTKMKGMFVLATTFNQPIDNWNVAAVTDMSSMFSSATAFNQPIASWDTGTVTDMSNMCSYASAFNQPIGRWNVAAVTTML